MKLNLPTTLLLAALGLGTPVFVLTSFAADKAPATKPAKVVRLPKPYSGLTSLSDEQKHKIAEIHANTLAEIKKLNEKETQDIQGQLTDDQKKELEKLQEAEMATRKAKDGAPKEAPAKEGAPK